MDIQEIKSRFPIFQHHSNLMYLDSAATSLKPNTVIEKLREYYEQYSANVERGLYPLSEQATTEYETAREKVARFIGAETEEIIFTRGTTESLNLLSYTLEQFIEPGDEILITAMEHHSNLLPWQALAQQRGAILKTLDFDQGGRLRRENLPGLITPRTKLFAFSFVSNVFGTINPVGDLVVQAKMLNPDILTIVDAAQAVAHLPIEVRRLGCDFLAFSGHKMFGPTGIGVLYGKKKLLGALPPFHYGGEMVETASLSESTFKASPYKFEAGTPAIAEAIALGTSIEFIQDLNLDAIRQHEKALLQYATNRLGEFENKLRIIGPSDVNERSGVMAFTFEGMHPHDLAHILGEQGICIRAGQHCATPLHDALHIPATARLSVSIYNFQEDIDKLVEGMKKAEHLFKRNQRLITYDQQHTKLLISMS